MAVYRLHNLVVETVIGVHCAERAARQPVRIELEFDTDAERAVESDDIRDAVDYQQIAQAILDSVAAAQFHLIEKLAAHVLDLVMSDERIARATVCVRKPQALAAAEFVEVEMSRRRHD
jgi:dihydroneopterin aldolase